MLENIEVKAVGRYAFFFLSLQFNFFNKLWHKKNYIEVRPIKKSLVFAVVWPIIWILTQQLFA